MIKYELTFLLNEESELKTIKNLVASTTGKVVEEQTWGQKALCYTIKKQSKAHFYNWIIEIPKTQIQDFKKKLNFNEKILRYLLLIVEK
ncbi:MAG: 30S ribosomal protein S6 [bacterium]|nr:30S ribosomal protein S6 [bacterium]